VTVFTGTLVFVCIWWMVLFCVLPWGVRAPAEPRPGHAPSAPERPLIARKMLITTAIAAVLFAAVYVIIDQNLISFRR
jgi:predicted secreted protein